MKRAGKRLRYVIGWEDRGRSGTEEVSAGIVSQAITFFQRRWRREHRRLPETYWVALCPQCLTGHRMGGCL